MKQCVDLNCDMGEGFGQWVIGESSDEALMAVISSANVATGFHAGDPNLMDRLVKMAQIHGVGLGAHPGFQDLQGFGRRSIKATAVELVNDIVYQIGALREFGRRYDVELQHVKPHGALYMEAAINEELSQLLVDTLRKTDDTLILYCMEQSRTHEVAKRVGHPVIREFYADRDYDQSSSIIFKRQVDRPDPKALAQKCLRACREGKVRDVNGEDIAIEFDSICFHSDTPGALEIAQAIRESLSKAGIVISSAAKVLNF